MKEDLVTDILIFFQKLRILKIKLIMKLVFL